MAGSGLAKYTTQGFSETEGWVHPKALDLVAAADDAQAEMDVTGGIMEIGVYHGRFFMALNSVVDLPYRSLAVDLFDDQRLNIDGSGKGDEARFRSNLELYDRHQGSNVEILAADSTTVTAGDVLARLEHRPRIVSVDGGHTPEHTISDIQLAHSVVHERGIVFVDDILNSHWLGVFEGVVLYLHRHPTLWPCALGYNKLLMCPMSVHARYLEWFRTRVAGATRIVRLAGYEVQVFR